MSATILRPDAALTGRWTVAAAVLLALALWIAVDVGASVMGWGFVALCLVPAAWVSAQALARKRFEVALDDTGIDVRLPWQREQWAWDEVVQARVTRVVGEDILELVVRSPGPGPAAPGATGTVPTRAVGVVLPMGADLPALHAALERHLGLATSSAS